MWIKWKILPIYKEINKISKSFFRPNCQKNSMQINPTISIDHFLKRLLSAIHKGVPVQRKIKHNILQHLKGQLQRILRKDTLQ